MKQFRQIGFTLIEVLVAITITIVLTTILMPVFSRAIAAAQKAACMANLHQLGLAILMYADDHDGYLPPHPNKETYLAFYEPGQGGSGVPTTSGSPRRLVNSVKPYTKNDDIWFCPADPMKGVFVLRRGIVHEHTSYLFWPVTEHWKEHRAWPLVVSLAELENDRPILSDSDSGPSLPELRWQDYSDHPGEISNYVLADGSVHGFKHDLD